jgi:hypothetical protein
VVLVLGVAQSLASCNNFSGDKTVDRKTDRIIRPIAASGKVNRAFSHTRLSFPRLRLMRYHHWRQNSQTPKMRRIPLAEKIIQCD